MIESDLRTLLSNLDACRASLHGRLHFWTFLVVVGVALEVISLIWEYARELKDFQRGEIHVPDKPSLLLFAVGFLGIALVVVGVSGELYVDSRLGTVETNIRKASDELTSLLSKESGEAKDSAKSAKESTAEAGKEVDTVKRKVKAVGKRAKRVDAELAQAEFLMSARSINNPKALTEQLRQFKGQPVTLRSYMGDAEAWGLCFGLWHVAYEAEMNATDECGRSFFTVPLVSPMSVQGPDDKVMEALNGFISRTGRLGVSSGPYANAPHSPTLIIFIGVKSPFMIGQARGVKSPANAVPHRKKSQSAKP